MISKLNYPDPVCYSYGFNRRGERKTYLRHYLRDFRAGTGHHVVDKAILKKYATLFAAQVSA
ncbi:hypothetical protein LAD67_09670 [Escherichia coli]|nr:hypothetical protein [Escherichia coli]